MDNIWGADLADIQLLSNFNRLFHFLLCVIDFFSRYVWVVALRDKKVVTIIDTFQEFLNEFRHNTNKVEADKGSEFCNESIKPWLEKSDIETHSTLNERKSVAAKRFVKN